MYEQIYSETGFESFSKVPPFFIQYSNLKNQYHSIQKVKLNFVYYFFIQHVSYTLLQSFSSTQPPHNQTPSLSSNKKSCTRASHTAQRCFSQVHITRPRIPKKSAQPPPLSLLIYNRKSLSLSSITSSG